jgi:hypothetical protein
MIIEEMITNELALMIILEKIIKKQQFEEEWDKKIAKLIHLSTKPTRRWRNNQFSRI